MAKRCPACDLSTAESADLVCRGCGARTAWDTIEELEQYRAECRAEATGALWRAALQFALAVPLVWVGIRVGLGYLFVLGLPALGVIVPTLGVAILLVWWGVRSLHLAWCLTRPVRLSGATAPDEHANTEKD